MVRSEGVKALMLAAVVLFLTSCASLPPTNLPVCAEHFNETCRAPVRCVLDEQNTYCGCKRTTESFRDELWERGRVCPWPPELREGLSPLPGHPDTGACYVHRGVMDSRAVYEYMAFVLKRQSPDPPVDPAGRWGQGVDPWIPDVVRVLTRCPPCPDGQVCRSVDGRPAACVAYVRPQ